MQYLLVRAASAGEAWRQLRNRWLLPYGGALLLIVALRHRPVLHLGRALLGRPPAGPGRADRALHALRARRALEQCRRLPDAGAVGTRDGLRQFFLLPVLGSTLFGWLAYALKFAANFAGPLLRSRCW